MPKSPSLSSLLAEMKMFWVLMSLWRMFFLCKYWRAKQIWTNQFRTWDWKGNEIGYFNTSRSIQVHRQILCGKSYTSKKGVIMYASCYETIMFGWVTYARRRCKARAFSVYITHILWSIGSCSLRSKERIDLYPFFCVSFTSYLLWSASGRINRATIKICIHSCFIH